MFRHATIARMLAIWRGALERYFEFERLRTNWRTEILAGATTFVTMAYIIFVNPAILGSAGMPAAAVMAATCLAAAFGSILMGAVARYPIALAPGMGLNAYFAYAVVKGMGVPWQTALGAIFLSSVAFVILTLTGVRRWVMEAIPADLYAAVSAGVGLFLAFIGLRNAGIVVGSQATIVALGPLARPETALAVAGLAIVSALAARGVRSAMLVGIGVVTLAAAALGLIHWEPRGFAPGAIAQTALQLDVAAALRLGLLDIVFVFFFVDLFDNMGTLVAVSKRAGLVGADGKSIPRLDRILLCDALAAMGGALAGTSTVVSYVESAAGVEAGGRSGVTAIVTGLLFLAALIIAAPLAGVIPASATAAALIVVGALMMGAVRDIEWSDPMVAIPAFLTLAMIPLTFSIANGLAFGFIAYVVLRVARGRWAEVSPLAYGLALLFVVRFAYLGGE